MKWDIMSMGVVEEEEENNNDDTVGMAGEARCLRPYFDV